MKTGPDEEPGYRRIGSLIPPSTTSPATSGSSRPPSGRNSSTTGEQLPARMPASSIGTRQPETGVVVRLGNAPPVLKMFGLPETSVRLARFIERASVWTASDVFGQDGQFEAAYPREVVILPDTPVADVDAARAQLGELMAPAPSKFVATKLAELRSLTAHRARPGDDVEMMATAFTARLAKYPADVVAAACDAWADREEWWPSWAELKAECDKRMRGRLALAAALGTR